MKAHRSLLMLFGIASVLLLDGCVPPQTRYSSTFKINGGGFNYLGAIVDPVGPPKWCYTIESFDSQVTNAVIPYSGTPMPHNPNGHPDGHSFTNLQVKASGCNIVNLTPGWKIEPGSSFVLTATNGYGNSKIQFCLECEGKTNGNVDIQLWPLNGKRTAVFPIAGPR